MEDVIADFQEPIGLGLHARVTVEYMGQAADVPDGNMDWDASYDQCKVRGRLWLPTIPHKEGLHTDIPTGILLMGTGTMSNWGDHDGRYRRRGNVYNGATHRLAVEAALNAIMPDVAKIRDAVEARAKRLELRRTRLEQAHTDKFDFQVWKVAYRLKEK